MHEAEAAHVAVPVAAPAVGAGVAYEGGQGGELAEAEGVRDKYIFCCGGARITHALAKELGYDAGFGAGTYADDVATFCSKELVRRLGK